MKMAKVQKATLDPTKISGRCGRLKCCLRYEFDTYEELQKEMPPIGSDVVTNIGRARVLGQEILSQQLMVATEDNRRVLVNVSDVLTVLKRGSGQREGRRQRDDEGDSGEGQGQPQEAREQQPRDGGRQPNRGPRQDRGPRDGGQRNDRPPRTDRPPQQPPENPRPESQQAEPPPAEDSAPQPPSSPPPSSPGDGDGENQG
jgi:hypothetical protein